MRTFVIIVGLAVCSVMTFCSEKTKSAKVKIPAQKHLSLIVSQKKMIRIQGGTYKGFIGRDSGRIVRVQTFYLDDSPVTNREYLEFLKANPQWTRSKVLRLYADSNYLKHWKSDYEIPAGISPEAPVTNISWFAAEAYAKSTGKRLPAIDEWEYAALADQYTPDASRDPAFTDYILKAYQKKDKNQQPIKQEPPNYYGIYNMYGMVWEWTYDFNSIMMSGESRKDNTVNDNLFCAGAAVTSSDLRNYAAFIRYALRGSIKADYCLNNLGFRCAKNKN